MTIDPELAQVVRGEIGEGLDQLLELGEKLAKDPSLGPEYVRTAFRIFHNTKGALRLGGYDDAEKLAHLAEDHLEPLRASGASPEDVLVDALEQALSACLTAVASGGTHADLGAASARLHALVGRSPEPKEDPVESTPGQAVAEEAAMAGAPVVATSADAIRVEAARLDRLMELGSGYLAQHDRLRRKRTQLREFSDRLGLAMRREPRLRELLGGFSQDFDAFVRVEELELRRVGQLTADFDRAMREVRMQPLSGIVPQLRRVVSEVTREVGKKVQLVTEFGDVELDRQVLDALREPLMHLLRNAIDHGIELDAERVRAKKPERGEVRVSARIEGQNVLLEVKDDGRGIDVERVAQRAVELELLTKDSSYDPADLIESVLFRPGFSTARQITSVSGRGVGLDVVQSRVSELGGLVRITSFQRGRGVTFLISVPTSIVSLRGLSVRAAGITFVLPSTHVERTLRVRTEDLGSAEGATILRIPGSEPLRLRWLASSLGLSRSDDGGMLQVVVLVDGHQRLGVVVEEVLGDTSFVIKRLPWNVRRVPGVVGASQQGDAALALVVDVSHVLRTNGAGIAIDGLRTAPKRERRRILVADDSLTSRTLERNILTGAGYEVKVVEDGQAALELLGRESFDLLVSDVQMPIMDGLELTRAVRAHATLARLPIILVTSLDRPEDLAEGARAGADEYIVKGQFDQEALLEAVSRLL